VAATPRASASLAPTRAAVSGLSTQRAAPDWAIARRNKPAAAAIASKVHTLIAPRCPQAFEPCGSVAPRLRAVAFGIERWRSIDPPCRGMIVWQLNHCWPVISWAAVDGDGRRKPLWYALGRVFAGRLLTLRPLDDRGIDQAALAGATVPRSASQLVTRAAR
jgi:hypothetical protein